MKPTYDSSIHKKQKIQSYEQLKMWRTEKIPSVKNNHFELNEFHDELIAKVVLLSIKKVETEQGNPPARFAFIVMGSAGRFEQSVWSDQDHGIIFEGNDDHQDYFLRLGKEIVKGLTICGYEPCDGKVMANNPLWCRSSHSWEEQLSHWLKEDSWENLRNTSIFIDSRVLIGDPSLLQERKQMVFDKIENEKHLLKRMADNVETSKKGLGWFGQLIPIQKGPNKGKIDFKLTVLFPFVNAMRLLSYAEKISDSSTLKRFQRLSDSEAQLQKYEKTFLKALDYRLKHADSTQSYENIHFINVDQISKSDRQMLKGWIKEGSILLNLVLDHSRKKLGNEDKL
ncbi:DUF294 nucleotidyltransferase-like domain-containing protein [Salipaludibacillus daqingensis]|uniref:DUF294 nucleotidyltransferase-like domain-containing protein n=1 Tax=Salipaludibacillus daqingensis TaxID=3041001 RepID=UPI002476BAB4|nr:DUF294 nucleotidyltransferase-like domain-containing protein [Salipaludibacillus daqingensis]